LDIHRDFQQEFSNSFFSTAPEVPANVAAFLARHGISTDKKIKVEEYCIKPKNALFILGTLAENPGLEVSATPVRTDTSAIKLSIKINGTASTSLNQTGLSSTTHMFTFKTGNGASDAEVIRLSGSPGPTVAIDMSQQQKIAAALSKAGITNPAAWAAAGITDPVSVTGVAASGDGTAAAPAPEQFDLHPPVVLMKGSHNPAFFISWRSQKDVVKS